MLSMVSSRKRLNGEVEFLMATQRVYVIDLIKLGLTPTGVDSSFKPEEVHRLFEFCKKNPSYHIISILPGVKYVNHYVEEADSYMLADGDPDPDLTYTPLGDMDVQIARLEDGTLSIKMKGVKVC